MQADITDDLKAGVDEAVAMQSPVSIIGGSSKSFYGQDVIGQPLAVGRHRGIADYEPSELVITVRSGTPLTEVEAALQQAGQMLPFEPPHFGETATIGGAIATGLSGPRRPYAGAARDAVLGVRCINGLGEICSFGGRVVKNVAGYDVSRLMTGALGTLGVLLELSIKVVPIPRQETTLVFELDRVAAMRQMITWGGKPLGLSAAAFIDRRLYVRLSGTAEGVQAGRRKLGGEEEPASERLWTDLREQRLEFFQDPRPLWRLSVPPACSLADIPGVWLIDWGGAQRWLKTDVPVTDIRHAVEQVGGHASCLRNKPASVTVFHPLPPALFAIHRRLKAAFDPKGIFNPGRLYPEQAARTAA